MAALYPDKVKAYLNITSDDNELNPFIDAAEAMIAELVGPLEPTTLTAFVLGGATMVLPTAPILSVTSAEIEGYSTIDLDACLIDLRAGIIHAPTYGAAAGYMYTVTYVAGWLSLPADLRMGVMELVRHLWLTQRGPTRRPGSTTAEVIPGAAYALPYRVEQLISAYVNKRVA